MKNVTIRGGLKQNWKDKVFFASRKQARRLAQDKGYRVTTTPTGVN